MPTFWFGKHNFLMIYEDFLIYCIYMFACRRKADAQCLHSRRTAPAQWTHGVRTVDARLLQDERKMAASRMQNGRVSDSVFGKLLLGCVDFASPTLKYMDYLS